MAATGDESVKLSQLKEWSETLGGGFSPAISEVTIKKSIGGTKTVTYMGVDGSYQKQINYGDNVAVQVPIMSNIYIKSRVNVSGGLVIYSADDMGSYSAVVCVTDPTCSITITS